MSTRPARPSRSKLATSCEAILTDLRDAYPHAIKSTVLLENHGPCAKTRIHEIKKSGFHVETGGEDGVATYRLVSLSRREAQVVDAGCIIRHDNWEGWTSRTHQEAIDHCQIPEEVLRKAEKAALDSYQSVVSAYLPVEDTWLDTLASLGGVR